VNEAAPHALGFALPILGRNAVKDIGMAVVITQLATPRKIKLAFLTLLFFAAMC
jgi:hypothetical protein